MAVAMTAGFDAQGEEIQKETDEAYCSEMCSNDNNYLSEQAEFWVSDASCPGYVPTGEATGGDPQSSASESNINDNDGNDDGNQDGLDGNDDNDDDGASVNMSRLEKTAVYVVPVLLVFFGVAYWFFDYRKRKQAAAADAKLEVELGQYGTDANNSFDSTEHAAVSSYTDSLQSPGLSLHDVPLNVGVLSSDHPLQSLHARNQQ